ncbi:MAG: response regulator transcription factor [Pseudomonadota bacterium]
MSAQISKAKPATGRQILVIEDETDIAGLIRLHLQDLCDDVRLCHDGKEGLSLALHHAWDLIVLDLRLPGVGGLDICRALREARVFTPILMLTSKSGELDRVLGLESGADDYLTKPFSILELIARVKAIFRRVELRDGPADQPDPAFVARGLEIDPDRREVRSNGATLDLTAREFDLLLHFARNPGKVFTRAQLLDHVWGYGHTGYEHTVNSHINRLRAKIESDPAEPRIIVTVWGVGYKFADGDDDRA